MRQAPLHQQQGDDEAGHPAAPGSGRAARSQIAAARTLGVSARRRAPRRQAADARPAAGRWVSSLMVATRLHRCEGGVKIPDERSRASWLLHVAMPTVRPDAGPWVCGMEDELVSASTGSVVWAHAQEDWFAAVNHLSRVTPWLHTPAGLYAEYGVGLFAALLLLSWWLVRREGDLRRVSAALWAPIGALVALGVNQLLVAAVAEPRPYTVLPHSLVLG